MPTVIAVRLKNSAKQLWFDPQQTGAATGDHVVVKTERGIEMGLACSDAFDVKKSDLRAALKPVLRVATDDDLERADRLARKGKEALPVFRELARKSGLDMKPVDVEFLFGGEKAVFYFTAEERVDFRQLVRELASTFHIRIDMRQIGVRDETQLVGGIAPCGQELCCVRLGGEFKPVSIRMAKEQDLSLNPLKISGFCGRLMCCLRYEYDAYKDFKSRAPKKNALIETPLGLGKVTGFDTPRELVTMRLENGLVVTVPLAEMGYKDGTVAGDYDDHAPAKPEAQGKGAAKGGEHRVRGAAVASESGDGATDDARSQADEGSAEREEEDAATQGDNRQTGQTDAGTTRPRLCPATASGKPPCPGRPCLVTRASLELHGNTQVALALAAYDREHGITPQDEYADDLVDEVRQRPKTRRRHTAKGKGGHPSRTGETQRRRGEHETRDGADDGGSQPRRRRTHQTHGTSGEPSSASSPSRHTPRRRHRAEDADTRQRHDRSQGQQGGHAEGHDGSRRRAQGGQGQGRRGQLEGGRPRPGQHSSSTHGQGQGRKSSATSRGQAHRDAKDTQGGRRGSGPAREKAVGQHGATDQPRQLKPRSGSGQRRRRRTHPGGHGGGQAGTGGHASAQGGNLPAASGSHQQPPAHPSDRGDGA